MNTENALKLAQYIEHEAEAVFLRAKGLPNHNLMRMFKNKTPCGTLGCIMGSFLFMQGVNFDVVKEQEREKFCSYLDIPNDNGMSIDGTTVNRESKFNLIISTRYWPRDWQKKYHQAIYLYEEMLVMANYLRFLVAEEKENK